MTRFPSYSRLILVVSTTQDDWWSVDGREDGHRLGADAGGVRHRGPAAVVATAAGAVRAAGPRADRVCPRARAGRAEDAADRGGGAAQAAEVVGAGGGARGDVLGLHHLAADDHRGLRGAVRPGLR